MAYIHVKHMVFTGLLCIFTSSSNKINYHDNLTSLQTHNALDIRLLQT